MGMMRLTVDEQLVEVPEGTALLAAIEKTGVKVPGLCSHKALSPYGACRLCVVEVAQAEGPCSLQAACSYPAREGLRVLTSSERVARARRVVAELLLARCPDSPRIISLAREYGVTEPRMANKHDDCIYCGLCERMCAQRMGRSAIGLTGRGPARKLEPPFGRHNEACWVCGACDFICPAGRKVRSLVTDRSPIPLPNPHNLGLDSKPAIHILYPQAVPAVPAIDRSACLHLQHGVCGVCTEICGVQAIDFEQQDTKTELNVGAIVLSPGFDVFDARKKPELGYGRYPNVITSLEFERIQSASGPFRGEVLRPSDGQPPRSIAFIQCVGSRDFERDYCSSVCCMYATKEALIAKEHLTGGVECDVFHMDVRAFGKEFERYYERARELGVGYVRCRPPSIEELPGSRNLVISYLAPDETKVSREYDLVVLSVGMQAPAAAEDLARRFGIELNPFGFCATSALRPVESSREGVYVAGPFTEPKDIPETIMQASGAASKVAGLLAAARGSLIEPREYPPESDVAGQKARVGVFVCHCGTNIGGVVNVPEVAAAATTLPGVAYATHLLYACSNDAQEIIKQQIKDQALNRVVVASCTPRTHEPLFRNTIREAGLNPYLFEMANIRDQCSWVHMDEPARATEKAKELVAMAVAKGRLLEPLQTRSVPVEKAALVIGGGLAGITSALELARQGFDVSLVEKEKELGGNLRSVRYLLTGEEPRRALEPLVAELQAHTRIRLFMEAHIEEVAGSIGNFRTKIATSGGPQELTHGVVVVATGARQYRPTEYLYGEDERVLTQLELEQRLEHGGAWATARGRLAGHTFVMIQCVGSRDEGHPYCSRLCCSEAVKNALRIKALCSDAHVYVLYRDVRTYGFKETYYTRARQKGVIFVRYEPEQKPNVSRNGRSLQVEVFDATLRLPIEIACDTLVLSAGVVPNDDNETIAQLLKVPLNQDGFFLEAHMKLRPVEFATAGVYLCGLAHAPKDVGESIAQAQAAAARAATVLSRDLVELEANLAQVVEENCDGCAYCVDPCPYHAITLVEYQDDGSTKKRVVVDPSACRGCGCCQATCPKKGIFVSGFKLDQISAQIDAALGGA